jgi:hypothetical protein
MKKTIILSTAILFAISASADRRTIKDRSENWLQHESSEATTSGDLRGFADGQPEKPTPGVPVGAMPVLLIGGVASIYGVIRKNNSK